MITLKVNSTKVVDKQEIANAFSNLEKAENDTESMKFLSEISDILTSDLEVEVTIEIEEAAITMAAIAQQCTSELANELVPELDDDYIEEEYGDRKLAKPLLASNFNAYDFKRQMCDFFETGYHVDSFDLVKLLAEKLQVDYLL
jgi:hypothetical protein